MAAAPREGYLVWTGRLINEEDVLITTAFVFTGTATARSAEASPADLARLRDHLRSTGEFVFAQVHSHRGAAFHSPADCLHVFSLKRGFISIVVPRCGRVNMQDLAACAVYELDYQWRRWTAPEVRQRIVIT
ncbi:MAG: hypothetical protein AB1609_16205 [Bacillota bacterium]